MPKKFVKYLKQLYYHKKTAMVFNICLEGHKDSNTESYVLIFFIPACIHGTYIIDHLHKKNRFTLGCDGT